MSSVSTIANRTAAWLDQLPTDQLGGLDEDIRDGLDQLSDAELVTVAKATAVTANATSDAPTRIKAVKVLSAAKDVAKARETVRPTLAKQRAFPEVFNASAAGEKLTAIAARRLRKADTGAPATGPALPGPKAPTRVARGPLQYYRLWEAQGKWGRRDPLAGFGGLNGDSSGPPADLDGPGPRDPIEAVMLGVSPVDAFGLRGFRGMGGLAGLNLGKFFKNLVKDVAPVASLAAAFIPGVGTAAAGILGAVGAAAGGGGGGPQPMVAGPPLATQVPQAQASGFPAWGWAALAGVGVLALSGRR